jgi:rhodanese-related sulfurtransferase
VNEDAASPTLEALLANARARIERFSPAEAFAAQQTGALIVDTRASEDRERDGIVPGSLHIPRTVLEWRTAPDSRWRNPHIGGPEREVIVLCDHGYSSILTAATLVELGFAGAGDVIGGFEAWRNAGLPVGAAPARRSPEQLPGMGSAD